MNIFIYENILIVRTSLTVVGTRSLVAPVYTYCMYVNEDLKQICRHACVYNIFMSKIPFWTIEHLDNWDSSNQGSVVTSYHV